MRSPRLLMAIPSSDSCPPPPGYNIVNFDLPYLLNRADTLKIPQFWTWGRIRNRWVRGCGWLAVA